MFRWIVLFILLSVHFPDGAARAEPPPTPLARTGQASCYQWSPSTATHCADTGQDGEIQAGVAWPDPRFVENGDGTVTDTLTGLAWTQDADPAGGVENWEHALDRVRDLNRRNHLGHSDWRLPNVNELESLVNKQHDVAAWLNLQGFRNVRKNGYWTSSTYAVYPACAWSVGMYSGIVAGRSKAEVGHVWPVRRGRAGAVILPKTGQTACYDASGEVIACSGTVQDGEIRAGADWPTPRFSENGDRTVTDRLTGLVWSKDADSPGPPACGAGTRKAGQAALDHVRCLNVSRYLGRSDWRLPNRNELASLVNRGQSSNAAWLNTQGFVGVQAGGYWSSSTYVPTPWNAWGVNMHDGAVTSFAKKHAISVWPVCGGR